MEPRKGVRQKDSIINDYRERIGHYLSTLSELLRAAVRAVLDYIQDGYRSFSYRQECDVKRYMNSLADKEDASGTVPLTMDINPFEETETNQNSRQMDMLRQRIARLAHTPTN